MIFWGVLKQLVIGIVYIYIYIYMAQGLSAPVHLRHGNANTGSSAQHPFSDVGSTRALPLEDLETCPPPPPPSPVASLHSLAFPFPGHLRVGGQEVWGRQMAVSSPLGKTFVGAY